MMQLKDYAGSVYGGLGQLLYTFSEAKGLKISAALQQVQNVERFDYTIWRQILDDIQLQLQRSALGLEIADYVQPKHIGIIGYIAQSCETLGEALTRYHDFHRLIYDGSPLKIEYYDEQHISIRWENLPSHLTTQITDEIAIAVMIQFLRFFIADGIKLYQVNFIHHKPKNVMAYEAFFNCPVKFQQDKVELIFPLNALAIPIKQSDQTLQKLLMRQAQALLETLPNTTQLDERLQQSILLGLQKNNYQIKSIAKQLNMSTRQLQRHLQSQDTTYQQRVQDVRQLLAAQYLQDPYLSLHEIALLLSYSEQSAFQRAFKQWTGLTPQQWRAQKKLDNDKVMNIR
ncbi:AraC family transcriptional regulator ligand-binding domain-containing protein [Acinetobacter sp. ULE_I010]|uniref:AraC family transcriptional regulator n=1 Tax=Acinetobacter sp. ULE_I010 TaxID=3373065 RepID=UPI003AF964FF